MALKVITPSSNTGFDVVGTSDYRAGMIAARASDGTVVVCGSANAATGSTGPAAASDKPIGILGEDRLTTLLQDATQVSEQITLATTVITPIALAHDSHLKGTSSTSPSIVVKIVSATDAGYTAGDVLALTTDYTINGVTGIITPVVAGTHTNTAGDVWAVTYTFQLNDDYEKNFRGVNFKGATDDTEGSKKATVWKGYGEFTTDQFDTVRTYAVGDKLYCTTSGHTLGAGLFTNSTTLGVVNTVVGLVTGVPTASDPFLALSWLGVAGGAAA